MRAVNLLPRVTSNRTFAPDRTVIAAIALTLLVLAAVVGGFFLEKANAATERQRLEAAQAALVRAQTQQPTGHSPAARLQIPVVLSQQEPWHVALDSALSTRVSWDVLLAQLEYVVPARVILTTVTLGSTSGAANATIALGGSAYSTDDVATFIATLERVPKLSQVALVNSQAASGVLTFQIQAQVALPAAVTTPTTPTTTGGH